MSWLSVAGSSAETLLKDSVRPRRKTQMGHRADVRKERSAGISGRAILEVHPAKIAFQRTFIAQRAP